MDRVMGCRAHHPEGRLRVPKHRLTAALTVVAVMTVGALVAAGGPITHRAFPDHSSTVASLTRTGIQVAPVGHLPVPVAASAAVLATGLLFLGLVLASTAGRRVVVRPAELGSRSPPHGRR